MSKTKYIFGSLLLASICLLALAQPPKPAPLKLSTKFGAFADSSKAFASDLKLVTNVDLKVIDNTGKPWTVVKYRFGWRRQEQTDDYKTGKRKTISQFYATDVDNSAKIPANWQDEIKKGLQAGEELLFESLIVQNPVTKKMMIAPSVHVFTK